MAERRLVKNRYDQIVEARSLAEMHFLRGKILAAKRQWKRRYQGGRKAKYG